MKNYTIIAKFLYNIVKDNVLQFYVQAVFVPCPSSLPSCGSACPTAQVCPLLPRPARLLSGHEVTLAIKKNRFWPQVGGPPAKGGDKRIKPRILLLAFVPWRDATWEPYEQCSRLSVKQQCNLCSLYEMRWVRIATNVNPPILN